MASPRMTLSWF